MASSKGDETKKARAGGRSLEIVIAEPPRLVSLAMVEFVPPEGG